MKLYTSLISLFAMFNNVNCYNPNISNIKIFDTFRLRFSEWDGNQIDTLIFQGGGTKAIVYGGCLLKLEEKELLKNIKNVGGTSSGSIIASLLASGYTAEEIRNIILKLNLKQFVYKKENWLLKVKRLITQYGYYDNSIIENFVDNLLENKLNKKKITFKELYEITNINLRVGVCSITERKFKYLDYLSYPDMPVSLGVSASCSIPLFFNYKKWNREIFIDGGLLGNLPTTSFPHTKSLAFNLISEEDKIKKNPKNINQFIKTLVEMTIDEAQYRNGPLIETDNLDIIEIYTYKTGLLNLDIDQNSILELFDYGYQSIEEYLKKT